ncbi:Ring finger domain-containing protein [Cladophialophora immunda]|nr:Ring finger domain-containing protein [Cladophialophora immunda]
MAPISLLRYGIHIRRGDIGADSSSTDSAGDPPADLTRAGNLAPVYVSAALVILLLAIGAKEYFRSRKEKRLQVHISTKRRQWEEEFLATLPCVTSLREYWESGGLASHLLAKPDCSTIPEEETICPFCLETIQLEDPIRRLPQCRHFFHQHCCDEWIRRKLQAQEDPRFGVTALGQLGLPFNRFHFPVRSVVQGLIHS